MPPAVQKVRRKWWDAEDICECINYKQDKKCVLMCQPGYYSDEKKNCHKCHKECKRCVGPSDSNCTMCENVRIYWDNGELDPNKTDVNYHLDKQLNDDWLVARRRRSMYMPTANESDHHHSWPVSYKFMMMINKIFYNLGLAIGGGAEPLIMFRPLLKLAQNLHHFCWYRG